MLVTSHFQAQSAYGSVGGGGGNAGNRNGQGSGDPSSGRPAPSGRRPAGAPLFTGGAGRFPGQASNLRPPASFAGAPGAAGPGGIFPGQPGIFPGGFQGAFSEVPQTVTVHNYVTLTDVALQTAPVTLTQLVVSTTTHGVDQVSLDQLRNLNAKPYREL